MYISSISPLISPFYSIFSLGYYTALVVMFLFWSLTVSKTFTGLHDLESLRVLASYPVDSLPIWVCLMIFTIIRLGL